MKTLIALILFLECLFLFGCNNSTEPEKSDQLRLTLSADKTTGPSPLTVNLKGKIEGNVEGLTGHLPDYFIYGIGGKTTIRYAISDTALALNVNWNKEVTFPAGEYKIVLLYQGIKDEKDLDLYSDTLIIKSIGIKP